MYLGVPRKAQVFACGEVYFRLSVEQVWVECVKRGLSRSVVCTGRHLCQLLRVFPLTFFVCVSPWPNQEIGLWEKDKS